MAIGGRGETKASGFGKVQVRDSLVAQFLLGAGRFAAMSLALEESGGNEWTEEMRSDNLAFVIGAVFQSCAALEAEIAEFLEYGPGHHLGSNRVDHELLKLLNPHANLIDRKPALERYQTALRILGRPQFDRGRESFQHAAILVALRNEVVHYKSKRPDDIESSELFRRLKGLRFRTPEAIGKRTNFFPHRCLIAGCAGWAVYTSLRFIDEFYRALAIPSVLENDREEILRRAGPIRWKDAARRLGS